MLKEFTINRPTWLIPEQHFEDSCLLSEYGNTCCLGAYGLQARIKRDVLFRVGSPEDVFSFSTNRASKSLAEKFGLLVTKDDDGYFNNSFATKTLMSINDTYVGEKFTRFGKTNREGARIKNLAHREKLITAEFAKLHVKVNFVGEYKING